jgi:hypothetical protein
MYFKFCVIEHFMKILIIRICFSPVRALTTPVRSFDTFDRNEMLQAVQFAMYFRR